MTGGLLQLSKYGAQNVYLNGNPQMTYFKSVYKRYSNFSMEMIRLDFDGVQELSYNVSTQLRCKILRNGDLVNRIYFAITLPDIYSSYHDGTNIKFQWVPNIGTQIVRKCTLSIGGNKISEVYGQWIEIWHELFLDTAGKNQFDTLTGHVPDTFMPAHNGWNAGFYPSSSLKSTENENPDADTNIFSNFKSNPFLQPPSIRSRQLYVPIPFWFCNNTGLALPLIALQYHEVHLELECRPITELYTILETREGYSTEVGARTAPDATLSHHHIGNFITSVPISSFTKNLNNGDLTDGETNIQGWNMDSHILTSYIFLDEDERKKFAKNSHEYLIEQTNRLEFIGIAGGTKTLDLQFNHPVKYMVWCAQRSDIEFLNRHNNYTNWLDEFIPPTSAAYVKLLGQDDEDGLYYTSNDDALDDVSGCRALLPTKFNFEFYNEDIIRNSRLLFDGVERYSSRDALFHRYLQSYQHNTKTDKSGIHMYSFALDPSKYQPSGACNMSRVSNLQLEIETNKLFSSAENADSYQYNVFVYAINYNILRITSGMGGLAFAN
tara:strand:- start:1887 stop:3536 length:1650 start_codon:yes stop_codon:yes gene_type:complete